MHTDVMVVLIGNTQKRFVLTLTLFRFSPLSCQIGAEQMNGSHWFRSADFSHTKHMTQDAKPTCVAGRPASWCSFIPSLDDVNGLGVFDRLRPTGLLWYLGGVRVISYMTIGPLWYLALLAHHSKEKTNFYKCVTYMNM